MDKPECCWKCEHLILCNPEEDECKLDGHIFKDGLILSTMRDKECPLDISELKGDKCDNNHDCKHCDWVECPN